MPQRPSQGLSQSGQLPLWQCPFVNGLFLVRPLSSGRPDCSWILTEVHFGPGYCTRMSLNFLASSEFSFMGTLRVVVAPSFWNHIAFVALRSCFLSFLVLYKGLDSIWRLVISFLYLANILQATISLSLGLYPAHNICIISLFISGSFWSQVVQGDMFLRRLVPSWTRMLYLLAVLIADLFIVISNQAMGVEK